MIGEADIMYDVTTLIQRKKRKKNESVRQQYSVSEILGTIILLSIAISLLTVVYVLVFNASQSGMNTSEEEINIVGYVAGHNIVLEHRGGLPLDPNIQVKITIGGVDVGDLIAQGLIEDTNGDGFWNIGERLVYTNATSFLAAKEVSITLVSPDSNNVILHTTIQEGAAGNEPFVFTFDAMNVSTHTADIKLYYDYAGFNPTTITNDIQFRWKRVLDAAWTETPWIDVPFLPNTGYHQHSLFNLSSNEEYIVQSVIRYEQDNVTITNYGTKIVFQTLPDQIGIWTFDETHGTTVYDTSGNGNHGTIQPNAAQGAQHIGAELEHSISALTLDGLEDGVQIPDSVSLDVTDQLSIEAWVNRSQYSGEPKGSILNAAASQFWGYLNGFYEQDITHVFDATYAVVFRGTDNKGYLITVNISDMGEIRSNATSYIRDMYIFEQTFCRDPKIVKINATTDKFVLLYRGPSDDGYLKTVTISTGGDITKSVIASVDFTPGGATSSCFLPSILLVTNNVYAIVYSHFSSGTNYYYGRISTVDLDPSGTIAILSTFIFTYENGSHVIMFEPEILPVNGSSDIYAVVYNCVGDDGGVYTVHIAADGSVTPTAGGREAKFDQNDCDGLSVINVFGEYYAVTYKGQFNYGYLVTLKIYANGSFYLKPIAGVRVLEWVDFLVIEAGSSQNNATLVLLDPTTNMYAVVYRQGTGYGIIRTVEISDAGLIPASSKDIVYFEYSSTYAPTICELYDQIFVVLYRIDTFDGVMKTIQINDDGDVPYAPIIDVATLGVPDCYDVATIKVSDEVIALVYRGFSSCGFIKTLRISSSGPVDSSFLDSKRLEIGILSSLGPRQGLYEPSLCHIDGNIFAVVYRNYSNGTSYGIIKTVKITNAGVISFVDQFIFDTIRYSPYMCLLDKPNNIYGVVYSDGASRGVMKTIQINPTGIILGLVDTYTFEGGICYEPDFVQINSTIVAVTYRNNAAQGIIRTFAVNPFGSITKAIIDSLVFDSVAYHPDIIHVNNTVYAVTFSSSSYRGEIRTLTIFDNGSIADSSLDFLEYVGTLGYSRNPYILWITNRSYALVCKHNNQGLVYTMRIGDNGDLPSAVDSGYTIPSVSSASLYDIKHIHLVDQLYTLVYSSQNTNDITIRTITIPFTETTRSIFTKSNSYLLQANATTVFFTIVDEQNTNFQLTAALEPGWNYITATYSIADNSMRLYINSNLKASTITNGKLIKKTTSVVNFGWYAGTYDYFTLFATSLEQPTILSQYNLYKPIP